MNTLTSAASTLGAQAGRLQAVVTDLGNMKTNTQNAQGTITNTDFAAETANMTRAQILVQAGTAMVSQANQTPNLVLTLLKNA